MPEPPYGPITDLVRRLLDDCRVMGPSAIERVAYGWERYAAHELGAYEQAALRARQAATDAGREAALETAVQAVRDMTEGHSLMLSWRVEREDGHGRTAEDAAVHAAIGLVVRDLIDHQDYRTLVKPMSETLPWLLPEERPDPRR